MYRAWLGGGCGSARSAPPNTHGALVLLACSVICSNTLPSLRMSLAPVGEGQEVTVRPYEGASLYASGSYSGRAIGTFQIDQPGRFLLQTAGEPEAVPAHVAVGQEIGGSLRSGRCPSCCCCCLGGWCCRVHVQPWPRRRMVPQLSRRPGSGRCSRRQDQAPICQQVVSSDTTRGLTSQYGTLSRCLPEHG